MKEEIGARFVYIEQLLQDKQTDRLKMLEQDKLLQTMRMEIERLKNKLLFAEASKKELESVLTSTKLSLRSI